MKTILITICLFVSLSLSAQIPDTIWIESLTDTTFAVAIGTMNKANDRLNITYVDQVFDSAGVANFAYQRIAENEDVQRQADLIKMKADVLTRLYGDVNSILQDFTGAGYLPTSFEKSYTTYIGYYQARINQSQALFQLKADGTAVEVNAQGQEVQNGFSGTWDVINKNRWRLKDFFPVSILPAGTILNRMENPNNQFRAVGLNLVVTKIRATGTLDE